MRILRDVIPRIEDGYYRENIERNLKELEEKLIIHIESTYNTNEGTIDKIVDMITLYFEGEYELIEGPNLFYSGFSSYLNDLGYSKESLKSIRNIEDLIYEYMDIYGDYLGDILSNDVILSEDIYTIIDEVERYLKMIKVLGGVWGESERYRVDDLLSAMVEDDLDSIKDEDDKYEQIIEYAGVVELNEDQELDEDYIRDSYVLNCIGDIVERESITYISEHRVLLENGCIGYPAETGYYKNMTLKGYVYWVEGSESPKFRIQKGEKVYTERLEELLGRLEGYEGVDIPRYLYELYDRISEYDGVELDKSVDISSTSKVQYLVGVQDSGPARTKVAGETLKDLGKTEECLNEFINSLG